MALIALTTTWALAQPVKPCDLMKLMLDPDEATAQRGIDGFLQMGAMGAVPLVCFTAGKAPGCPDPTPLGKLRGEEALVRIGSGAVPAVLARLNTTDKEYQSRLVRVLAGIKDVRREQPLKQLWPTEKSDRVRAALVHAMMQIHVDGSKKQKGLELLRERIAKAKVRELRALAMQFAVHGTDQDLAKVLASDDAGKRDEFISATIKEMKQIQAIVFRKLSEKLMKQALDRIEAPG